MKSKFKYNNIKNLFDKNKRIFLGAFTFSLFVFGIFFIEAYSSYKSENNFAETQSSNLALVLDQTIQNTFKKVDLVLLQLQDFYKNEKNYKERTSVYNNLLLLNKNRLPEVLSIKVVDENGEFLGDDLGYLSKKNLRDREYFQTMKKRSTDQLFISKPVISKTVNKWVIVLSRPILSNKGEFKGLILATIPLEHFKEMFSNIDVGKNGAIAIIDYNFYLYARKPWREDIFGKKLITGVNPISFISSNEMAKTYKSISSIDAEERIFSSRKLKGFSFAVIVGLSEKDFLIAWKVRTFTNLILITLLIFIFFFFLLNFVSSLEAIGEQRKQAIQSAKLSSLGEMASGVAHEINNPLTIISFHARSLKKANSLGNNDSKINESADKIFMTVDRIAKIVKSLRAFSRDSFNDVFQVTSTSKIIELSLELCLEKLKDQSIELTVNNQEELYIDCNEIQITQVIVNLLHNSKDAIDGTENKWIKIDISKENNFLLLAVSDSGKKLTDEIADKIMQPFFTTKEIGKGIGLGLSISKGIIESHKGLFYIDRHKRFNTFVMKIPLSSSEQNTKKAA